MRPIVAADNRKETRRRAAVILLLLAGIVLSYLMYQPLKKQVTVLIKDDAIETPVFSQSPGFYDSPFELVIKAAAGTRIYYTTDGSIPTLNSNLYKKPLIITERNGDVGKVSQVPTSPRWKPPLGEVEKGTVIRAIAVSNDSLMSPVVTNIYFVGLRYTLPVVSITAEPGDLFDYKQGIYVMGKAYEDKDNYARKKVDLSSPWWEYPANYKSRGSNAERPVTVQLFGMTHSPFTFDAGVRISGNATRAFAQKSLRIVCRKKYGTPILKLQLYEDDSLDFYRSFVLRNSGNDWDKTMLRDVFMQSLLRETTRLDLQRSRPVIVFINGEYWGIHHLTERIDESYLSTHYGISTDSLTILENNGAVFYGKNSDALEFSEILAFAASHDLSQQVNYRKMEEMIDIGNLTDYLVAEIYFANTDWPNNNTRMWRYSRTANDFPGTGARDGRWRWMVSDLDWGFGYTGSDASTINMFEKLESSNTAVAKLFRALNTNSEFRKIFHDRFMYHLQNTFVPADVNAKLDKISSTLAPEMPRQINRWRAPASMEQWEENLQAMHSFAEIRPVMLKLQLQKLYEQ